MEEKWKKKFMVLAYVDDLAIVANSEEEMTRLVERFMKYVVRKKLVLNINKTKMMVFGKEGKERSYV